MSKLIDTIGRISSAHARGPEGLVRLNISFKQAACWLCKYSLYHLTVYIGQTAVDPVVIESQFLVVEAQQMKDRCMKVRNRNFIFSSKITDLVRTPVSHPFLNTSSS